jgi:hypothetical protein
LGWLELLTVLELFTVLELLNSVTWQDVPPSGRG